MAIFQVNRDSVFTLLWYNNGVEKGRGTESKRTLHVSSVLTSWQQ